MRRAVALWTALFVGLGSWITAGALLAEPPRAAAQTESPPPVMIERRQEASFLPRAGDKVITVLAIGSDARPDEAVDERLADSIHLITVNPEEGAATILGLPRDTLAEIPGMGTRKINDALADGGPELVAQTIESLTGIRVDYFLLTGFLGMRKLVNGIGGLTVDIPHPMSDAASGANFEAGPTDLDGEDALALARNRKDTPDGDFSRSENQGLILQAAHDRLRESMAKEPAVLFEWIAVGLGNLQSNLSLAELFELGLTAIQVDPEKVDNVVAPGGVGTSGGASVVILSDAARAMFQDLRDDGILSG